MKKDAIYNQIIDLMKTLSPEETEDVIRDVMQKMGIAASSKAGKVKENTSCSSLVNDSKDDIPNCPHCGAKASRGKVVKVGFQNGDQRYFCKECESKFKATTGTLFYRARKGADVWEKYIRLTLSGASITTCQEECGLSRSVAFNWRHKLLHVFEEDLKNTNMTGTVEVDEMLIPISYKGNHVQGAFGARKKTRESINDMPRNAYKRGTDNISRSPKDKACVFCMVEDGNKRFYAAVPGVGFMSEPMLNATIAKHTDKEKVHMLADNYKTTHIYFANNGYAHTILASNTSSNPKDHKPEVKDGLHLQHVNAMHHHIRNFLRPYYGVSSKYLSHYIALYTWLKNIQATKRRKSVEKVSIALAATPGCYIAAARNDDRPAVPRCA